MSNADLGMHFVVVPVVHILIGDVRKAAKVVWQKGDQVGLQFLPNTK